MAHDTDSLTLVVCPLSYSFSGVGLREEDAYSVPEEGLPGRKNHERC